MEKVICIIFIYTFLILSGTDLFADQEFLSNGPGNGNGNGYGHGYDIGNGHGYDIGNGPGNGNGYGHTGGPPGTNAPEPISSALFILGGAGLGLYKRFKNKD
jgi:hypothetical protein